MASVPPQDGGSRSDSQAVTVREATVPPASGSRAAAARATNWRQAAPDAPAFVHGTGDHGAVFSPELGVVVVSFATPKLRALYVPRLAGALCDAQATAAAVSASTAGAASGTSEGAADSSASPRGGGSARGGADSSKGADDGGSGGDGATSDDDDDDDDDAAQLPSVAAERSVTRVVPEVPEAALTKCECAAYYGHTSGIQKTWLVQGGSQLVAVSEYNVTLHSVKSGELLALATLPGTLLSAAMPSQQTVGRFAGRSSRTDSILRSLLVVTVSSPELVLVVDVSVGRIVWRGACGDSSSGLAIDASTCRAWTVDYDSKIMQFDYRAAVDASMRWRKTEATAGTADTDDVTPKGASERKLDIGEGGAVQQPVWVAKLDAESKSACPEACLWDKQSDALLIGTDNGVLVSYATLPHSADPAATLADAARAQRWPGLTNQVAPGKSAKRGLPVAAPRLWVVRVSPRRDSCVDGIVVDDEARRVYAATDEGDLRCISKNDGSIVWSARTSSKRTRSIVFDPIAAAILVAEDYDNGDCAVSCWTEGSEQRGLQLWHFRLCSAESQQIARFSSLSLAPSSRQLFAGTRDVFGIRLPDAARSLPELQFAATLRTETSILDASVLCGTSAKVVGVVLAVEAAQLSCWEIGLPNNGRPIAQLPADGSEPAGTGEVASQGDRAERALQPSDVVLPWRNRFVTLHASGRCRAWDFDKDAHRLSLTWTSTTPDNVPMDDDGEASEFPMHAAVSHSCKLFLVGFSHAALYAFDEDGKQVWQVQGVHRDGLNGMIVDDARGLAWTAGDDGTVRAWRLEDGKLAGTAVLNKTEEEVVDTLAVNLKTGQLVAARSGHIDILEPPPDASAAVAAPWVGAVGGRDAAVAHFQEVGEEPEDDWDPETDPWRPRMVEGEPPLRVSRSYTYRLPEDLDLCVWNGVTDSVMFAVRRSTERQLHVLRATDPPGDVKMQTRQFPEAVGWQRLFSAGRHFICIDEGGVLVLDAETLAPAATFTPTMSSIRFARLSPDASHLFVGGTSGELVAWNLHAAVGWAGVQIVRDPKKEQTGLDTFQAAYAPWLDFAVMFSLLVLDFLQMLAFSFSRATPPSLEGTKESLQALQQWGTFDYSDVFLSTVVLILCGVAAFAAQERVETGAFTHPHSPVWKVLWLVMSYGLKILTLSALVPLLRVLVEAGDCTFTEAGATWDMELNGESGLACFGSRHLPYLLAAAVLVVVYVPLSMRFLRVNGNLAAIDARLNPFDWSGDRLPPPAKVHVLSLADRRFWMASLVGKVALTVVSVFLQTRLVPAAILMTLAGAALALVGILWPPYFSAAGNKARTALDFGALWMYVAAVAAAFNASADGSSSFAAGSAGDTMLSVIPACMLLVLPLGWLAHTPCRRCLRPLVARTCGNGVQSSGNRSSAFVAPAAIVVGDQPAAAPIDSVRQNGKPVDARADGASEEKGGQSDDDSLSDIDALEQEVTGTQSSKGGGAGKRGPTEGNDDILEDWDDDEDW